MSRKFYLGDSDSDTEESDIPLPFPEPLSRAAFTSHPEFSATAFLASLHNRHQSLEDLRLELRNRSKELERELVELVNRDYVDFLGLGSSLSGGEGKVEDLRVGLLQMRREVETLVNKLEGILVEVEKSLKDREAVRRRKNLIRTLLTISHRLTTLEVSLLLEPPTTTNSSSTANPQILLTPLDISPSAIDEESPLTSLPRLLSLKTSYLILLHLISKIPPCPDDSTHPFLLSQNPRVDRIRKTLLLDLGAGLKQAIRGSRGDFESDVYNYEVLAMSEERKEAEIEKSKMKVVKLLEVFEEIGEDAEAVKILKETGASKDKNVEKQQSTSHGHTTAGRVGSVISTPSKAKISLMSNIGITQQHPGPQKMEMKR